MNSPTTTTTPTPTTQPASIAAATVASSTKTKTSSGNPKEIELLRKHFESVYQKTGVALTIQQLMGWARKQKLSSIDPATASSLLRSHSSTANFGRTTPRKIFQSIGVPRAGEYQIDYGEFHKSWSHSNGGSTGFLVAVENFTNRLHVYPSKGKGTTEWLNSIARFVELSRNVRTIYSDRDSVATSKNFRTELFEKYGIEWHFLRKGNKAFRAERYIGFVKTKLSQALASPAAKKFGEKKWTVFVEPIVTRYNKEVIFGTSYSRQSVDPSNFDHFIGQLFFGKSFSEDATLSYNGFAAGPFATPRWNKKIFKFNLGDRVLVARKANWKFDAEKLHSFRKISADGGFGKPVYTVSGRQLRLDKTRKCFVPVYSVAEFDDDNGNTLRLNFYENELRAAPTIPSSDDAVAAAAASQ